jgi:PH domain
MPGHSVEHRLLYYRDREAVERGRPPRGVISLANAPYVGVYEGKPASCTVQISTPARTFFLQAESQDLMWGWLNRLQAARGTAGEKPNFLPFAAEINDDQRQLTFLVGDVICCVCMCVRICVCVCTRMYVST